MTARLNGWQAAWERYRSSTSTAEAYAKIYSTIRTYEEIVDGNYIDNLLKAERERTEAEQKKENAPEQPIKPTINRKMHRR